MRTQHGALRQQKLSSQARTTRRGLTRVSLNAVRRTAALMCPRMASAGVLCLGAAALAGPGD